MKKGLLFLIAILLLSTIMVNAQNSKTYCTEMAGIAKKLAKKVKKKHIKKANELYPQAVKAIEKAKIDYPKEEFGNDKLVAEIPSWIKMYKALAKIEGGKAVDKKGNTFEFVIVDYNTLLEEVTLKAGEAHYKAGKELMESEDFEDLKIGFAHFDKAQMYVKTYKDEIDEIMVEKYYLEGVKYLNSSTLYSERQKCVKYFKSALKIKNPYKDINELTAELYYAEGDRIVTEAETSKELISGIKFLRSSLKYIENYKDANEKITAALEAGAEIAYNEAIELESEESFEGQAKAEKAFEAVNEWSKDYKDANERAAAAKERSGARILIIGANGKILDGSPIMKMNQDLNKGLYVYNKGYYEELVDLDLNDDKNYVQATELSKKRFIYVKFAEKEDGEFTDDGPKEYTKDVVVYAIDEKDKERKIVTKKEYDKAKKIVEVTGTAQTVGFVFHEFKGVVKTVSESVTYKTKYVIEVMDARNPDSPFQLGSISIGKSFSDSRRVETYTGDDEAKPNKLANDTHELLTEVQLKEKTDKEDVSIATLLNKQELIDKRYVEIVKILNKNVEYVSFQ